MLICGNTFHLVNNSSLYIIPLSITWNYFITHQAHNVLNHMLNWNHRLCSSNYFDVQPPSLHKSHLHFRTCTFGSGRSNTVLTHEQDMRVVVICEYCHDACQPRRGRNKTPHTNNTNTRGRMPPASLPHSRCQPLLLLAPCIHPFPNFLHLFPCLHPFTTRGEGMELRGQDLHLVLLSLSRRVCDSILKARSSSSPSHILWWCRKTARERKG
jgi:hypothetical protein